MQGVIVFDIGGHKWTLDLTSGTGSLTDGVPDGVEPDLTLTANDDNFAKLVSGQLNPQQVCLASCAQAPRAQMCALAMRRGLLLPVE